MDNCTVSSNESGWSGLLNICPGEGGAGEYIGVQGTLVERSEWKGEIFIPGKMVVFVYSASGFPVNMDRTFKIPPKRHFIRIAHNVGFYNQYECVFVCDCLRG